MNRTVLRGPPQPSSYKSLAEWADATYQWMVDAKARIETDSNVNTTPVAPFVIGTYTAVNTLTGTDSTSNFIATLVAAMTSQGIVAPVSPRTTP